MNILFTNIGRRNYLIDFANSIEGIKIFASDCDEIASGALEKNVMFFRTPQVSNNPNLMI